MDEIALRSPADLVGEPDPVKRFHLADEHAGRVLALVGEYNQVRREALAELSAREGGHAAAGRAVGIHRNTVGDAVRQVYADDRELFDDALQILARPGASGASGTELMRGLAVTDLAPKARRVQFGAKHLTPRALAGDETDVVARAVRRAGALLAGES